MRSLRLDGIGVAFAFAACSGYPGLGQVKPPHAFQPLDPAWTVKENLLKLRPDAFVLIKPEEREPGFRDYWRELRYFNHGRECKIMRHDPEARLRMEADISNGEQFTRTLYVGGSLAEYTHWKNGRWMDGISVSPDGKTVHRVVDGSGELVSPGYMERTRTHQLIHKGEVFLTKEYTGEVLTRIILRLANDRLSAAEEREELFLSNECEAWRKERNSTPDVQVLDSYIKAEDGTTVPQIVPPKTDIRRIPVFGGPRELNEQTINEIRQEWNVAFPKRRVAFLTRYADRLKSAGHNWAELGIDFIRVGGPWSK